MWLFFLLIYCLSSCYCCRKANDFLILILYSVLLLNSLFGSSFSVESVGFSIYTPISCVYSNSYLTSLFQSVIPLNFFFLPELASVCNTILKSSDSNEMSCLVSFFSEKEYCITTENDLGI